MNARNSGRLSEWWEWIAAGSLSLASCAALLLLLVTLARAQVREALRAECQTAGTPVTGVGCVCVQESGRSRWLATGTRVPSCRFCQTARGQTDAAGGSVWSKLRYETTQVTTADSHVGYQTNSARTTVITVSVVLAWLLGLRAIVGPLRPLHHVRHGHRRSPSF